MTGPPTDVSRHPFFSERNPRDKKNAVDSPAEECEFSRPDFNHNGRTISIKKEKRSIKNTPQNRVAIENLLFGTQNNLNKNRESFPCLEVFFVWYLLAEKMKKQKSSKDI